MEPVRQQELRALERARTPIWIYDLDRAQTWWANPAALSMWAAESVDAIQERQSRETMTDGMRRRLDSYRASFLRDETVSERWTYYPEGRAPVIAECDFSGVMIEDASGPRLAMLVEARPVHATGEQARLAEALMHIDDRISLYGQDGQVLMRNPTAKLAFGPGDSDADAFAASFVDAEVGALAGQLARGGDVFRGEVLANTVGQHAWYDTEVRRVVDPVSGEAALLVVQHDVSARHEAEAQLAEASRAKSAFLATMSHELRTPMTGVLAAAELLRDSGLDDDQREALDMVQTAGEQMVALIDDVLDISRIEAGRIVLDLKPVNLADAVRAPLRSLSAAATRKGLKLEQLFAADVPERAITDRKRLAQILTNLVANAIKFTRRGSVTIAVSHESSEERQPWLTFEVRDTGVGIAPDQLEAVFAPFEQVDSSRARSAGGAGLGLHIARSLAEVLGGTLGVESKVGEGSLFRLRLPFRAAPDEPMRTSQPPPRAKLQSCVLVAEDNALNRRALVRLLRRWGCTVHQASDGAEALEVARAEAPDVVLMDINMPGVDGHTAARTLREETPSMRLVALTADAFFEDVEAFDLKLTKPVDWDLLHQTLLELAQQRS